jgi:uncharacterized small protein (DUF1192 family)
MNADQVREKRIQELGVKLCVAETLEERIALWSQLRAEIARRSPAQVARMEKQKGLR